MKAVFLKGRNSCKTANSLNKKNPNNSSYRTHKPSSHNTKLFSKANLHYLLNKLIVESNEEGNDPVVTEDIPDNNESILLVNSTITNKLNPGDIMKLLCVPGKG